MRLFQKKKKKIERNSIKINLSIFSILSPDSIFHECIIIRKLGIANLFKLHLPSIEIKHTNSSIDPPSIHAWIPRDVGNGGNSGDANMQIFELPSEHVGAGTSIESREVILKKTYW